MPKSPRLERKCHEETDILKCLRHSITEKLRDPNICVTCLITFAEISYQVPWKNCVILLLVHQCAHFSPILEEKLIFESALDL